MKTDYKNDILADSMNDLRRYEMINNDDETVSFRDVSEYTQKGDRVTAGVMNEIGEAINKFEGYPNYNFRIGYVSVPYSLLGSLSAGATAKLTIDIPNIDGYEPVLPVFKGSGSNNVYNYYNEIRPVYTDGASGKELVKYTLYSEWKNAGSSSVTNKSAIFYMLYRRSVLRSE